MNLDLDETERRARNAQVGRIDPNDRDRLCHLIRMSAPTAILMAQARPTILELIRRLRKAEAERDAALDRAGHAEEQLRRKEATIAGGPW